MAWTHSAYPCLQLRGQQLTKTGAKENDFTFDSPFQLLQTLTADG